MELLLIPLALTLVSLIIPKDFVKYFALLGALASLVFGIGHLCTYDVNSGFTYIFNPEFQQAFGLTFNMGYDGMGLIMILLTSVIIPLVLLSNFNREI
ncbi:MAG: hypothetical protein ACK5B9_14150, partial [Flavobacteriia bacterium]